MFRRIPFPFPGALLVALLLAAGCRWTAAPAPSTGRLGAAERVALSTPSATATEPPTYTQTPSHTPTRRHSPTPGPSPTPSETPTPSPTPVPSRTPTPTPSLTPSPTSRPQSAATLDSNYAFRIPYAYLTAPPPTAIPSPVPTFELSDSITNVLLLGSDVIDQQRGRSRTDSIIIVSINRETRTATMLSLPRDLYVFVPGWGLNRINTVLSREPEEYPGGAIGQLKDTILYNLGVPIHYYARVDFEGFQTIVDVLGGVEVAVSCELTDWRLKSPELDITVEENYERFTLVPAVHLMDGDLALWYARSRMTTNDFDRGRRQQQLLRAILDRGLDLNLLTEVPTLWNTYQEMVETDMDIGRMLQLASLAPDVRQNGVQHLYLSGDNVRSWTVPATNADVELPNWPVMSETLALLFTPPALNQATRPPIFVEIINATGEPDMALLAADNLAWYGFAPIISEEEVGTQERTSVQYFARNLKGSYDWLMRWILNLHNAEIRLVDNVSSNTQYRVVLGQDYDPCRPQVDGPIPRPEED